MHAWYTCVYVYMYMCIYVCMFVYEYIYIFMLLTCFYFIYICPKPPGVPFFLPPAPLFLFPSAPPLLRSSEHPRTLGVTMTAFPDALKNAFDFLEVYPYPAYILQTTQKGSRAAVQLEPIWSNPAYDLLIPPGNLLSTLSHAAILAFGSWAESSATDDFPATHLLKLDLGQIQRGHPRIELEVTKTVFGGFLICTSIPRTPLPIKSSLASQPRRKRKRLPKDMKLLDLPTMTFGANGPVASVSGSAGSQSPSGVPTRTDSGFVTTAHLMETFDWASTPLGPRETWPTELNTLIKYMNGNPHPVRSIYFSLVSGPPLIHRVERHLVGSRPSPHIQRRLCDYDDY